MERNGGNSFSGHQAPPYYQNNHQPRHHHQQQHHQQHHHHYGGYHQPNYGHNGGDNHRMNYYPQHHHYDHQNYHHHHQSHHEHYPGPQNMAGGPNGEFSGGGFGRKRSFQSPKGVSPDGGSSTKLYVASVSRTATEEDIRGVFREHGHVVEIIIPRDKRTGERGGYCFVKYKTTGECDRAIAALQNQYTFPGELAPIKVRYAEGERDRPGRTETKQFQNPDKLYVGCLSKETTKMEIQEVFSVYGMVEDIYIVRDEHRQSRGCAFVQFSHRDMAFAAIKALNGVFKMRGCDQPLVVKYAEPKRSRPGDMRFAPNMPFPMRPVAPNPHLQQLAPVSHPQQFAPVSHPQVVPPWATRDSAALMTMQQQHDTPPESTHIPQHQSCHQAASEVQKSMHPDTSPQNLEPRQNSESSRLQARSNSPEIAHSPIAPQDSQLTTLECDWSEHTCPDGFKYYYNCTTCESKWEKPEEYSQFEKQLQKQRELQHSARLEASSPRGVNHEEVQDREVGPDSVLLQQKLQVSAPTSGERSIQTQSETSIAASASCA